MKDRLRGKVAIITGAASGLGKACAHLLAMQGASVVVADIDGDKASSVAAGIVDEGGQCIAVRVDVTSEDQVRAMVAGAVQAFGRIDVLYNNAALLTVEQRSLDRDVCNMDGDAWDRAMAVNLKGAMLCSKHTIPVMLKGGGGSLIHAASGLGAQGDITLTAYAASKAGLMMLSKSIAAQYGKQGIRSNAVQIGLVLAENAEHTMPDELKTIILDQHLTPTLGQPRNIADVVAFLASDESAFITGHTLVVDGGFSSHTPSMVAMKAFFEKQGSYRL